MKGKISKKVIVGGIVIITLGVVMGAGFIKPKVDETLVGDIKNQLVKVDTAKIKDIQTKISASGMIEADTSEKIYMETASKVTVINKKVGDEVKKGDVLITFDPETRERLEKDMAKLNLQIDNVNIQLEQLRGGASTQEILQAKSTVADLDKTLQDMQAKLRSANESLKIAEKDVEEAKTRLEVEETLLVEGISSQLEVDNKKKELDGLNEKVLTTKEQIQSIEMEIKNMALKQESADYNLGVATNTIQEKSKTQTIAMKENELASLNIQKENLQLELDKAKENIVAPIDGVIQSINIAEGQTVPAGTELMTVIGNNKLIVKADVSPYYVAQLKEGLPATIKYNGSQIIEATGKVSRVSPTAVMRAGTGKNEATSTVIPVEIELEGDSSALKPGLVVDIKIITEDIKGAVTVPLLATMEDKDSEPYIFVVKSDNTLEKRTVEQGAADSLSVQIKNMEEGEMVVTNPTETLQDGMAVSYRKEEAVQ